MKYLSVCSGIEAVSVAWTPLGFDAVAFSEIEAFPSAVLRHHYPDVPNYGDLTRFRDWPDADVDVLVGGTPCQSFSVAGLRAGLADPRGNLALTYLAVLDRYRPRWCCWENVPGVLSADGGGALGAFLGGLGRLGYGFAYRVLDAQYFGLAQRRARVFVVGHLGDWRRAAAVLFERESLSGHPAPRRETGEGVAPTVSCGPPFSRSGNEWCELDGYVTGTLSARTQGSGGLGTDFDVAGGLIAAFSPTGIADYGRGGGTLRSRGGDAGRGSETLIAHALRGDGFDASEDGTGRGTPLIAFSVKDHGADAGDIAPTLRAGGYDKSHANGGVMPAVAFDARQSDVVQYGERSGPLDTDGHSITVAFQEARAGVREYPEAGALRANGPGHDPVGTRIREGMQVRRLTPRECERLQGFPDDYTLIPYRGKPAADGPRYKALGNSMAVPVMAWIGQRMLAVEGLGAPPGENGAHR